MGENQILVAAEGSSHGHPSAEKESHVVVALREKSLGLETQGLQCSVGVGAARHLKFLGM